MLSIKVDQRQIARLGALMTQAGPQASRAIMRAVNHTGKIAYTAVAGALARQTGLKVRDIKYRVVPKPALPAGRIIYRIVARAPALPLSDFKPVQARGGVRASPWRKRRLFAGAFVAPSMGSHVFVRSGAKRVMTKGRYAGKMRQPLKQLWGPVIANDLVRGDSKATFETVVNTRLLPRLEHELSAILLGHSPPAP